jgi:RND family efflux transporter MFP subunit
MKPETKHKLQNLGRFVNTAVVVGIAVILGGVIWKHYRYSPWTRDGRVRAEVVHITPEVSGKVETVAVSDNQHVQKGQLLFTIESESYRLALTKAQAAQESRRQDMLLRGADSDRRGQLSAEAISKEEQQTSRGTASIASASYQEAEAECALAKLNLDRCTVRSPVNGFITNLHLRTGDYATSGQTNLVIIDSDSFWVAGYFEETKVPRIRVGDSALVALMGADPAITGHVESITRGIADQNGGAESNTLATVDPVFNWVRLAQRIPVRIHIDHIPEGVVIASGMTCTINLLPHSKP